MLIRPILTAREKKRMHAVPAAPLVLLALPAERRKGRLVGGLRRLVFLADDERGRWHGAVDFANVVSRRLLVLEGEPASPVGRVGCVSGVAALLRRGTSSACTLADRGAAGTGILFGSSASRGAG
ncbi:hypothetical protein D1007_18978 [Hordeum vulgare]|nr:hypothetical protein D1007_18978 [Hordeum vulgare]